MKKLTFALCVLFIACTTLSAQPEQKYEPNWDSLDTRPIPEWFNQAKFGIFVVWGPYSVPAWVDKGYAEWYGYRMRQKDSPTQKFHNRIYGKDFKYEQFAPLFNAEMFDPEAWADLFVKSGAKYVVTTANYHDGFCLYPSEYDATENTDKWNSTEVGPMRDLLGELNEAGRKKGLKMGIYYSLYEWFHPLWLKDRDRYVTEKFHPQFKEVVTKYTPPVIFLDGEWEMDHKRWKSEELAAWLYNDSPVADYVAVNDRWGKTRGTHGDFYESEYGGGKGWADHPWQEDRGIGHSYGYNRNETIDDYDSREELIRMLSRVAGNGGNFLLDVGPTADGRIPVIMQERLLQIGDWLKINGDAIYGSTAGPYRNKLKWGTTTAKPGKLFVHVWGDAHESVELPGLKNKINKAYLLTEQGDVLIRTRKTDENITLTLPKVHLDKAVSIVVLEILGSPFADGAIMQKKDGSIELVAIQADTHGSTPQYEPAPKDQIGYWSNPADYISWTFEVKTPGTFDVNVTYSYAGGDPSSKYTISLNDRSITAQTQTTGAWDKHRTDTMGKIKIEKTGKQKILVKPETDPAWKSMGLRSIVLTPSQK